MGFGGEDGDGLGAMVEGGGAACISPRYGRMKVLGLRSLDAKSPDWPAAGWDGEVIVVILTTGYGPYGLFGVIGCASLGRV